MKWSIVFILQFMFQTFLQVSLTAHVERDSYSAELGGDVVMGCRFYPLSPYPHKDFTVTWHQISPAPYRAVYRMDGGQEEAPFQHPDLKGRARLLAEEIKDGWAKLRVSSLRINDTGTYQCVVQTTNGADYKKMTLSVTAPYKTITKYISKSESEDELVLSCQSEGYPVTTVVWEDGHGQNLNASTAFVSTVDHLFRIITQIRVASSQKNNYTCRFESSDSSATFLIPDETQLKKENTDNVVVIRVGFGTLIGIALIGFIVVLILLCQKRSLQKKRRNAYKETITILTEDCKHHQQEEFEGLQAQRGHPGGGNISGKKGKSGCDIIAKSSRFKKAIFPALIDVN
ncbi:programmed cell death 1 ligand 1-like isoform X2 [Vanacampus margaritifer]